MTTLTAKPPVLSKLIAARERGMPLTLLIALVAVAAGAWVVKHYAPEASWTYQFFFERSVVQGVLMVAFALGCVHLFRRLPACLRERRAFESANESRAAASADTLVGRRRRNISAAIAQGRLRSNLDDYARSLADHDAAEIDATYRVSGDIVQVLPLIGFFGTVLGLSMGLYDSYLAAGGTTAQGFAKAIALAFDNTLLGLLLTILLFIAQSVMRKRDEALLLRLDLEVADAINAHVPVTHGPVDIDVDRSTAALHELATVIAAHSLEMVKTRAVFEQPGEGLRTLIEVHTTQIVREVLTSVAAQQRQAGEALMQAFTKAIDGLAGRVIDIAGGVATRVSESWEPLCSDVEAISEGVSGIEPAMQELQAAIAERTAAAERSLLDKLAQQTDELRKELRRPRTMTLVECFVEDAGN